MYFFSSVFFCPDTWRRLHLEGSQWVSNNIILSDNARQEKIRWLRRAKSNKHMSVFCLLPSSRSSPSWWFLPQPAPFPKWADLPPLTVIWQRDARHQSGVPLVSPSAPSKLWFALQRCLSHQLLREGASLIIFRDNATGWCSSEIVEQGGDMFLCFPATLILLSVQSR